MAASTDTYGDQPFARRPGPPAAPFHHHFESRSGRFDSRGGPPQGSPSQGHHGFPPAPPDGSHWAPPAPKLKRRRGTGLVFAALLVGLVGGVGGAVGYDFATDQDSPVIDALSGSAGAESDEPAAAGSVEAVADAVSPSVVQINVSGSGFAGSGSGVILTSDGEILTNNHVVEAAAEEGQISVTFSDGTSTTAQIVGRDPLTDLALIQAEGVSGVEPVELGSSENLDVGEQVVAIGSPFGLSGTVTSGIVSAIDRPVRASGGNEESVATVIPAIQTDAAINPGNSGGPLVNLDGQVVGINSAIRTIADAEGRGGSIGLGFAIPIDQARPIVEQLRASGTATHAQLGVTVRTEPNDVGVPSGAAVQEVTAGAAAEGELGAGDVIVSIEGTPVATADDLVAQVRSYRPGDEVEIEFRPEGGGDTETVTVALGSDGEGEGP